MRVSAALITAVLPVVVLNRGWGAAACPQAATATTTATPRAQCAKPAKAIAKAPAAAVTIVAAEPISAAESWHSTLDPLAPGGWVLITDGPIDNPSVVYASTHNVLHNGNVVTAWVRWEYSRIQAEIYPLHYQSAVTHEELDCDARTYRRAAVFYYRRNNLQDKALQFTALNDDTTWKLAIPGSEGDAMLNWACTPAAAAHHAVAETKAVQASDKADAKTADTKSGSAAAAASSAPAAAGGGINLHTSR
jgi:hypothetical protein